MKKEELKLIKRNIINFNGSKFLKDTKLYKNTDNGISFSIHYNKKESIVCFYSSKSAIDFILNYNNFSKKNIRIPKKVLNKSRYLYNKFISSVETTSVIGESFRNINLINPYRNFKINTEDEIFKEFEENKVKIYLHSGFVYLFISIQDVLYDLITDLFNTSEQVTFIGHSFGAPIAKLAFLSSILANTSRVKKTSCFLYGSPKIGNSVFENFIDSINKKYKNIYTVSIDKDTMCKLPVKSFGYAEPRTNFIIPTDYKDSISFSSEAYMKTICDKKI